jgi:Asp-tRNA(Asn)/Glu-tRNA(Gln) amidotransferase A subunit family amidase
MSETRDLPTIARAAAEIRRGRLRPRDLVERCLERIRRYDDRLRAWVLVDEDDARRQADDLGRQAAAGQFRGPLHGIPVGIKDIFDVAGLPTRAGSPLRENHLAQSDAPLVAALRRGGAVLLGKTVTVEFACFDPPPTRNPWDPALRRTPGGSSSGSAVALAMGMCLGALGTQTGGSLVRPAAYCGVCALKPTFGRLSTEGVVPVSVHLDHCGPMARTVEDLGPLMACLDGDPRWEAELPPRPPRLGWLERFFIDEADAQVRIVMSETRQKLEQAGAVVVPLRFEGDFDEVAAMHRRIMAVEAATYHRGHFPARRDAYGAKIAALLDEGLAARAVDFADALAWQRSLRNRVDALLAPVDALLVPATDTTAPSALETTGTPKFQAPWSCAGVPVVAMPAGLADDGVPVGLQLVGHRHGELALFHAARWCASCVAFAARPPLGR